MIGLMKKIKPEREKFDLYKVLAILLLVSLSFSLVVSLAQIIIEATKQEDTHFRAWWLWTGYWEFIYFFCIIVVAFKWRPSQNNHRLVFKDIADNYLGSLNSVVPSSQQSHNSAYADYTPSSQLPKRKIGSAPPSFSRIAAVPVKSSDGGALKKKQEEEEEGSVIDLNDDLIVKGAPTLGREPSSESETDSSSSSSE